MKAALWLRTTVMSGEATASYLILLLLWLYVSFGTHATTPVSQQRLFFIYEYRAVMKKQ